MTLTPFCFITHIDLSPAKDAAAATSRPTFSFTDHSTYKFRSFATPARDSMISEEGVPGYPVATLTPPSRAPRTIASFPMRRCELPACPSITYDIIRTPDLQPLSVRGFLLSASLLNSSPHRGYLSFPHRVPLSGPFFSCFRKPM